MEASATKFPEHLGKKEVLITLVTLLGGLLLRCSRGDPGNASLSALNMPNWSDVVACAGNVLRPGYVAEFGGPVEDMLPAFSMELSR